MSKKGTDIVKTDIKELIALLNKAFADEWLAYYQYWIGARVVKGLTQQAITAELNEHAAEELEHAQKLADRIIQLGGTPILHPGEFGQFANCSYMAPKDPNSKTILEQNIKGERCAIGVYDKILSIVKDKDEITYDLILSILKDEVEHESDLLFLLDNLK